MIDPINLKFSNRQASRDYTVLYDAFDVAQRKVVQSVAERYYRARLCNGESIMSDPGMNDVLYSMIEYIEMSKKNVKHFYWITINPRPDVTYDMLCLKVQKALSKNWIRKCTGCYEVRDFVEGEYTGLHVHMRIETFETKRESQVVREFRSTFKSLVGKDKKMINTYINIKQFPYDGSYYQDKQQYLDGVKWDPKKQHAIDCTNAWRKENQIDFLFSQDREVM